MSRMSLEQAKKAFFLYGCSKFIMGRENPELYQKYMDLNIKKNLENEWREEQLIKYANSIKVGSNKEKCWIIYNKMYELIESIRNRNSILLIDEITKFVVNKLIENERIIIAETIIGRKSRSNRSGLIYMSFDVLNAIKAKEFANHALLLLEIQSVDAEVVSRVENLRKVCDDIMRELSIK